LDGPPQVLLAQSKREGAPPTKRTLFFKKKHYFYIIQSSKILGRASRRRLNPGSSEPAVIIVSAKLRSILALIESSRWNNSSHGSLASTLLAVPLLL